MAQDTASIENSKFAGPMNIHLHRGGLRWKISTTFSGLILLLGLLVIMIVYHFTSDALQRQVELRSTALATNLSDTAAGFVSRRSTLELDALVAKYGRLDGVAYAFVQDPKGEVLASSMQPFPAELKDNGPAPSSRVTRVRGKSVYETRSPLLDGQLGVVRIGLWAETVENEVRSTLWSIIGLIAGCLALSIMLSIIIAGKMIRPILDLKAIADDISRGRLDTTVTVQSNDEVGELGRSLERMRASLKAAMNRLSRE